ncbi:2'-5' RNA ligase superfamily-domain-containing protein [Blastocladiella britannica]|nr:2'-5' RNA ligase superfamily-domain-containing protein [Blastocladiella britannica]
MNMPRYPRPGQSKLTWPKMVAWPPGFYCIEAAYCLIIMRPRWEQQCNQYACSWAWCGGERTHGKRKASCPPLFMKARKVIELCQRGTRSQVTATLVESSAITDPIKSLPSPPVLSYFHTFTQEDPPQQFKMDSKHHLPVPRNTTSVTTALAVIPPPALWPRIQTMRRTLDPAFPRWPPHINLLYPFLHPRLLDDDAQSLIASAVGALDEERVALTATEIFYARNRAYVIAQPPPTATGPDTDGCNDDDDGAAADDLLQQLHRRLLQEFPACASLTKYAGGYTPHLTLARTNWNAKQPKQHREAVDQVAAAVQRIVSPSDGRHLSWDAQGVYLLTRPGGSSNEAPFSFSAYYPLAGGDAADPYGLVGTTYDPNVLPPTPTATTTMEADGRDRRASFSEVAWPHPHGIVGIAEPGSDDDPQSLDSTPPTPPLPPESASEPLPVPPATRPGFHDTWTAYPRAASPSDLTAAKYDQTWLLLPTSRYSADDRKWAPVDPESIAAMPVSAETAPERLSVLTYNVLNPNHYPLGQRTEALLTDLAALASDLHLIAFQEVTSGFLAQVLDQAWVRDGWYVSHGGPEWCEGFPGAGGQVILARVPFATMFLRWTHQKHALAVQIPSWNAVVVNVHLTSSHATNTQPAGKRLAQMESVAQFLARHSPRVTSSTRDQRPSSQQSSSLALVVGDWNTADPAENALLISRHGLVDSAELLGESLITFDPTTNALAREISSAGADATGRSIDRVIMRPATGWFPVQQRLVGEQHAAEGAAASDHYGLVVSFQHLSGAEHGSLLPLGPSAAALDAPLTQAQIHQALTDLGDYDSPSTAQKRRDALHLVTAHLNALRGDVPPLGVPFLIPVGSAKLGLHSPSSDVDSIALISVPTETFCDAIKATPIAGGTDLRLIQVVPYATVPTARFLAFNEIAVDVQLASPGHMFFMKANEYLADPLGEWPPMRRTAALALASFRVSAALAMHLTPVTRLALRVLRRWATLAGIYASRPGYFNGTALLVMLLRVANADPTLAGTDQDQDQGQDQDNVDDGAVKNAQTECSVARLVAAFFREYHQFPFGSVMVQAFADAVGPHPEATLARPSQLVRDILAGNVAGHSMFTMRYPLYINARRR